MLTQYLPCTVEQMLSCLSQNDMPRRADEQFCPDFGFQLADLHADSSLRDVDSQRGRGECARLSDGHESFQLSNFQYRSPDITMGYRNNKIF